MPDGVAGALRSMAASPPSILSASSLASLPPAIYLGPSAPNSCSRNNVAASFWSDFFSFSICATATIAVATTSLISDWLLWRVLDSLNIPGYSNFSVEADSSPGPDLGRHMQPDPTEVLHVILIISSVTYCIYFLWLLYMFSIQRSVLKDRWDGLPNKNNCLIQLGGEIFTLLLAVIQDIPVSSILFAIQAAAGCQLVVITDNAIFLLATCSTLVSLVWKVGQVVWNLGCFGFRYEYLTSKGLVALRWSTVLVSLAGFALAISNLVLLCGYQSPTISTRQLSNSVMDKVGVDRWWRQDSVVLVVGRWDANASGKFTIQSKASATPMSYVLKPENPNWPTPSMISCQGQNYDFTPFLSEEHQRVGWDSCILYFGYAMHSDSMTIQTDFRYTLQSNDSCWTGTLSNFVRLTPSAFATSNHPSNGDDLQKDNDRPLLTAASADSLGTTMQNGTLVQQDSFHSIILDSYLWPGSAFSCRYLLNRDQSLLASYDMCR